ncbi:MAG: hypothetical protein RI988_2003 [Pseudomonadota bacterium]|jgi:hypothetical protein
MSDAVRLPLPHRRRLREVWRSAGWPCRDTVELELLAHGLLARERDAHGCETLHLTPAGVQALAGSVAWHRHARSLHERLVARVALDMQRAGRIVWRGLVLRAPVPRPEAPHGSPASGPAAPTRWVQAMPDVYSIRHTTREDQVLPIVHEIKVRRADLLADLRRPGKRAAYLALASQCWYVLKAGIAEPGEIPPECGVMVAHGAAPGARAATSEEGDTGTAPSPAGQPGAAWLADETFGGRLEVLRPAPQRPHRLALGTWMALARASAEPQPEEAAQPLLRQT